MHPASANHGEQVVGKSQNLHSALFKAGKMQATVNTGLTTRDGKHVLHLHPF